MIQNQPGERPWERSPSAGRRASPRGPRDVWRAHMSRRTPMRFFPRRNFFHFLSFSVVAIGLGIWVFTGFMDTHEHERMSCAAVQLWPGRLARALTRLLLDRARGEGAMHNATLLGSILMDSEMVPVGHTDMSAAPLACPSNRGTWGTPELGARPETHCRGLSATARLIGTAGALSRSPKLRRSPRRRSVLTIPVLVASTFAAIETGRRRDSCGERTGGPRAGGARGRRGPRQRRR